MRVAGTSSPAADVQATRVSRILKLLASCWMIMGRLEVYTLLVIFTPGFWRF